MRFKVRLLLDPEDFKRRFDHWQSNRVEMCTLKAAQDGWSRVTAMVSEALSKQG
jgi:hypothetical protein